MRLWGWISFVCVLFSFQAKAINAVPYYSVFYLPASDSGQTAEPYIEIYWQIDAKSLNYSITRDSVYLDKIATYITLEFNDKTIKEDKYLLETTPAADIRAAKLQNILDLHRYKVPIGTSKFTLHLIDLNDTTNKYTYTKEITVTTPTTPTFYSDLQLLDTSFASSATKNIFFKNNRIQFPLSSNFLDDYRSRLHYYVELYESQLVKQEDLPLVQYVYISKKNSDAPIYKLKSTDTIQPNQVTPILGKFDISMLPSGNYNLNIILTNSKSKRVATKTLFFQLLNTDPVKIASTSSDTSAANIFEEVEMLDLGNTFVSKYNYPQLKAILKMCLPISNVTERDNINSFIKNPDETYIRYFIYNFWKGRNPSDPKKAWEEHADKVRFVNKNFGSRIKPGYETDRGRIFLTYGEPDQRVVVTNESSAYPYEVWQYNAPGQQGAPGSFLFYQPPFMVGGYMLLHSTVRGEIRNTAWRQMLYSNGNSTKNLNSRAEQFFQDNNGR
ncbi:MAG: GWxTD domain-containing protein [Flavipsychrobacter sp.]